MSKQKLLDGEEVSENGICWASFHKDSILYHRNRYWVSKTIFRGKENYMAYIFNCLLIENFKKLTMTVSNYILEVRF